MVEARTAFVIHPYFDTESERHGWAAYDDCDVYKGWSSDFQWLLNAIVTRADKKREKAAVAQVVVELRGVQQQFETPPEVLDGRVKVVTTRG